MVLVRQQKGREAEAMLARLSDLLRFVLDDVEPQEVPLRRELECLQLYLSIFEVFKGDGHDGNLTPETAAACFACHQKARASVFTEFHP